VARDEFRSAPFYAVILKGAPPCAAAQKERAVTPRVGFIAVYAGDTEQQGQAFLATVKETGRFPGANLRRMQAMLVYA